MLCICTHAHGSCQIALLRIDHEALCVLHVYCKDTAKISTWLPKLQVGNITLEITTWNAILQDQNLAIVMFTGVQLVVGCKDAEHQM